MTVPPVPDCQTNPDLTTLRRQVRAAREALVRALHDIENQISGLDHLVAELDQPQVQRPQPVPNPLEVAPRKVRDADATKPLKIEYFDGPKSHIVLEATGPAAIEQHLEQATLEELNQALSKAFSQVSGRNPW